MCIKRLGWAVENLDSTVEQHRNKRTKQETTTSNLEGALHDDTKGMDDGQDPLAAMSSSPQSERASSKLGVVDNGKWRQTCATMMLGIKSSLWTTMCLTLWTMAPVSTFMHLVLPHLTQHLIARFNKKSGSPHQQHLPFFYPATMMMLS